jgi:hypothetical protein
LAGAADGVKVSYLDECGLVRSARLAEAGVDFASTAPVRSFPSYRGQRSFPGFYFAACMGRLVGFESWLERDEAMAMDFDPCVTAFAAQPFRLEWTDSSRRRSHVPDFFARRDDGSGEVVDCRPENRIKPADRDVFDATAGFCDAVGWGFRLVHGHEPVWLGNVRWLAGYRMSRCCRRPWDALLLAQFAEPGALIAGARAVGDPIAVLPTLYHLLWIGRLHTDLSVRLDALSVVACP